MVSQPRPATHQDLPALRTLWLEFMDHHAVLDPTLTRRRGAEDAWAARIKGILDKPDHLLLVCDGPDGPVGYLKATNREYPPIFEEERLGIIQELIVTEAQRRQGHGRRLYHAAESWFRHHGITRLEACIDTRNESSRAFWAHLGYARDTETLLKQVPRSSSTQQERPTPPFPTR